MRSRMIAAACVLAAAGPAAASARAADVFTPLTATPLSTPAEPVLGTDGRWHVVYELQLANAKLAPATLRSVSVLDARDRSRVVARWSGRRLVDRLRTLLPQPAKDAVVAPNAGAFLYVELSFAKRARIPRAVVHRFALRGAADPGATRATPLRYTVAPVRIAGRTPVLGPPLRGDGWVAANGCCNALVVHRGSIQTVNGGFFDAQRYAIDWMRLDAAGRLVSGDPSDVRDYAGYGAPVLAVADAKVVATLDRLPDQVPGTLPDPGSLTIQTVDGNHVVLALGHGRYAFYAHLQRGSVAVKPGQRVKRGQLLGRLGNSGNTSAPHLHFHLMDGPSVLGSDGLPYTIRRFGYEGRVPVKRFEAAPGIEGVWDQRRLAEPQPRRHEFPLNLDIISFR